MGPRAPAQTNGKGGAGPRRKTRRGKGTHAQGGESKT